MGMTLAEKIISAHCGKKVKAGEIVIANVDLAYAQDGTGPLTVRQIKEMGKDKLWDSGRVIFFIDHASPSPRLELSNDHKLLRAFARESGARLSDIGGGISHHVVLEEYAEPGQIILGADSHTCTNGALCAFATGVGSTDAAFAMVFGKTWLRVPETIKIEAKGRLQEGVYAKDLILKIIGILSSKGATYKALEFTGEAIEHIDMAGRATLANMAVEAGAKTGMVPTDDVTREFMKEQGRGDRFRELKADPDAQYERVLEIDAGKLEPTVACPHLVDNVKPVGELEEVWVDQVFIGTSCNGRIEDFHAAARIFKGRRVADGVRLIITPASRKTYFQGLNDGTWAAMMQSGGVVTGSGCGACVGVHEGVLADGEVCLATNPRNFKGRMGNPNAFIYLGSPALAAATAVTGKITDPREFL